MSSEPPPPLSMPPIKLSFGPAKALPKKPIEPKRAFKPTALSLSDDDTPLASTSSSSSARPVSHTGIKISTATLSRAQKKKQAEEVEMNKEVYAYDEVWDNMKEGDRKAKAERMKDDGERKPKYISKLIETAGIRARDRVRAEDKMVQREREMEGAEFGDKDSFVTPAYKAQQEELRKVEEEEKKKEAANASSNNGLSSFYAQYLSSQATAHDAAVAASLASTPLTSTSTAPSRGPATEVEIAAQHLAKTGKAVEVNDEGVIIDKRQLLEGGLNLLSKPNERGNGSGGFSVPIAQRKAAAEAEAGGLGGLGGGLSAAERGRQSRERHSREVERQMVAMEERKKRDAEEELGKEVKKVAKRNDETKVQELKRKAEERRKKREEDEVIAAAAAAAAPPP